MASKTYFFTGKANWAKLTEPDQKYQFWGLDLVLDKDEWDKFKESGLQLKVNKTKEGEDYVSFRRPQQKVIKNELVDFDPPVLVDKDNEVLEDRPNVGNGSTVTCKVLVYDTIKGKGHRLEGVRIDNLIEFIKQDKQDEAPF